MRVWDQVPPENLCDRHLLGEHREIHSMWTSLTKRGAGYRSHPEVKRWQGHLPALKTRHNKLAREMRRRGMNHQSPLPFAKSAKGSAKTPAPWDDQKAKLAAKGCDCEEA
jgi:hypothetical protein